MARTQTTTLLRHIRNLLVTQAARESNDGKLLERFNSAHDEQAFAALLHRHGGLVWGVCRQILRNEHDAEDAFQATFLVLARRSRSIRKCESLASWLYGVAYRIAVRARRQADRRVQVERQAASPVEGERQAADNADGLGVLVNDELRRLPEKQRLAFILCCIQGKSRKEAAAELKWKLGTLASRLDRARATLRRRLARRGVAVAALAAGGLVEAAYAEVPAALACSAARAGACVAAGKSACSAGLSNSALALAKEALRNMVLVKARSILTAVLAIGILAGAIRLVVMLAAADDPRPNTGDTALDLEGGERNNHFDDPLPPGALARLGTIRLRHPHVSCLRFSADGTRLFSQGRDGARSWDVATGKQEQFVPYRGEYAPERQFGLRIAGLPQLEGSFSGDGKLFAMSTKSGVRLFGLNTGAQLGVVGDGSYASISLSSDGKFLATEERRPRENELALWDVDTARHSHDSLAISADGGALALNQGSVIRLLDVKTGKNRFENRGHKSGIRVIAATDKLVTSDYRRTIFWDPKTATELQRLEASEGRFPRFKVLADGRTLMRLEYDNLTEVTRVWNLSADKELRRIKTPGNLLDASPDGNLAALVKHDGVVRLVEVATGGERRQFTGHHGDIASLAFAPNGRTLISAGNDTTALIWDLTGLQTESARLLETKELPACWRDLALADAAQAYTAMRRLSAAASIAVPYLKEHLRPIMPPDQARVAKLIADLGSAQFGVRKHANDELIKLGDLATAHCQKALTGPQPLEWRRRLEALLEKQVYDRHHHTGEHLRALRCLEVLEIIGGPQARALLEALAGGASEARLTREASACLQRLMDSDD